MAYPVAKFPANIASATDLLEHINVVPSASTPTLASTINNSVTSLSVGSGQGSQFPASNFVISIDDEIMFVGSRSGDTLSSLIRGYEGTTAASHTAGAQVLANVTALAHNQMAAEVIALEQQVFAMQYPALSTPVTANFTDSAWGGGNTAASLISRSDRMVIEATPDDTWHLIYNTKLPIPAPPYTVECGLLVHGFTTANLAAGVAVVDSSVTHASMTDIDVAPASYLLRVFNLTSPHTATALTSTTSGTIMGAPQYHRITDDGVNKKFWSSKNGKDWALVMSTTSGAFLTAAYGAVWLAANNAINSANIAVTCVHYQVANSILPQYSGNPGPFADSMAGNWADVLGKTLA